MLEANDIQVRIGDPIPVAHHGGAVGVPIHRRRARRRREVLEQEAEDRRQRRIGRLRRSSKTWRAPPCAPGSPATGRGLTAASRPRPRAGLRTARHRQDPCTVRVGHRLVEADRQLRLPAAGRARSPHRRTLRRRSLGITSNLHIFDRAHRSGPAAQSLDVRARTRLPTRWPRTRWASVLAAAGLSAPLQERKSSIGSSGAGPRRRSCCRHGAASGAVAPELRGRPVHGAAA